MITSRQAHQKTLTDVAGAKAQAKADKAKRDAAIAQAKADRDAADAKVRALEKAK